MFWLSQLWRARGFECGSGFSRNQWSLSRPVGCSVFGASRGRKQVLFVYGEVEDRRSASRDKQKTKLYGYLMEIDCLSFLESITRRAK